MGAERDPDRPCLIAHWRNSPLRHGGSKLFRKREALGKRRVFSGTAVETADAEVTLNFKLLNSRALISGEIKLFDCDRLFLCLDILLSML